MMWVLTSGLAQIGWELPYVLWKVPSFWGGSGVGGGWVQFWRCEVKCIFCSSVAWFGTIVFGNSR